MSSLKFNRGAKISYTLLACIEFVFLAVTMGEFRFNFARRKINSFQVKSEIHRNMFI